MFKTCPWFNLLDFLGSIDSLSILPSLRVKSWNIPDFFLSLTSHIKSITEPYQFTHCSRADISVGLFFCTAQIKALITTDTDYCNMCYSCLLFLTPVIYTAPNTHLFTEALWWPLYWTSCGDTDNNNIALKNLTIWLRNTGEKSIQKYFCKYYIGSVNENAIETLCWLGEIIWKDSFTEGVTLEYDLKG